MSRYFTMILLSLSVAAAQSTNDLTAKYGSADVERYEVASGVTLTVLYGKDRQACQMKIEARRDSILAEDSQQPTAGFSSDFADRLVNELVPAAERKGEPREMMQTSGCAAGRSTEYENVRIYRGINQCQPRNANVSSVSIQWTRLACIQK